MTSAYALLDLPFLGLAVILLFVAVLSRRAPRARAVLLAGAIVLAMTAVFDNVMIGVGLVGYDRHRISGLFVGIAPLEDFAYAIAAAVLLPALWMLLPPFRGRTAPTATPAPASGGDDEHTTAAPPADGILPDAVIDDDTDARGAGRRERRP